MRNLSTLSTFTLSMNTFVSSLPATPSPVTPFLRSGWGFDVGQNFARAAKDTPCEIAPNEYAKPGHVIAYIPENPESSLGFLRYGSGGKVRIHARRESIANL